MANARRRKRKRGLGPILEGCGVKRYDPEQKKQMKKSSAIGLLLAVLFQLPPLSAQSRSLSGRPRAYTTELQPYLTCLRGIQHYNPVDYVMRLFESKDIVILCQRDGLEGTQYALFFSLMSDRRFIDSVGGIFTDAGSRTANERLDAFLTSDTQNTTSVQRELIGLYRDITWSFFQEKYGFYSLLEKLHFLNARLPPDRKLSVFLSDLPFDWRGMTGYKYQNEFVPLLAGRDASIAAFVISTIERLDTGQPRRKYLLIMEPGHASRNLSGGGAADYIFRTYPERTVSVMVNAPLPGSAARSDSRAPVMNGKWDAAFRYLGNPAIGFDLKDSPFGRDRYDDNHSFQDVFDGFIFSKPLEKHVLTWNIPGFVDEGFLPVLSARIAQTSSIRVADTATLTDFQNAFNVVRSSAYPDLDIYERRIRQWLVY